MSFGPNKPVVGLETDLDPQAVVFTLGTEAADVISITMQVKEHGKNCSANGTSTDDTNKKLLRVWISTTSGGAPSDTSNTVAVTSGTTIQTITANADYVILTGTTGSAAITLEVSGAATRYVMAEIAGQVYAKLVTFAA